MGHGANVSSYFSIYSNTWGLVLFWSTFDLFSPITFSPRDKELSKASSENLMSSGKRGKEVRE